MSAAWEMAKAAVLARRNDPHTQDCEPCAAYVSELTEMEQLGRPTNPQPNLSIRPL